MSACEQRSGTGAAASVPPSSAHRTSATQPEPGRALASNGVAAVPRRRCSHSLLTVIRETAHVTTSPLGRERRGSRAWTDEAVRVIDADANRSADTHLHPFPLPEAWGIDLYLKDESVHPTGSLN